MLLPTPRPSLKAGRSKPNRRGKPELRYSVGLPSAGSLARWDCAETVDTSTNKAIAALVRLASKARRIESRSSSKG